MTLGSTNSVTKITCTMYTNKSESLDQILTLPFYHSCNFTSELPEIVLQNKQSYKTLDFI